MTDSPDVIKCLVERFGRNIDSYRSGAYSEAHVRCEFIDPMFKALGWDVNNEAGYAEAFKEVIHEDAIRVGGATKAPDYCFRIGGTRKFFLEAKKPAVSIQSDPEPAYQLRRYAWSAKLPLSILTDFEEFAVYDCRTRPVQTDKSSTGRTLYLKYTDYLDRWDDIAGIFSKEAILKGSFDKYAESTGRKRGTAEVDASFLAEIESWRDVIAHNIALRNKNLRVRELNEAVQRTVDRILFLRMCEDRGIENYGRLQALLNTQNVYGRLGQLFSQADDRYNSGLFHFKSEKGREAHDAWTLDLAIDDKVLKDIIKRLYYPECPFEFSVLPADILGQIYERFLGKVIRLTAGHQAKVEEKPEVRKAGGVYYTPTYIVDYIVKNTVGKLCEPSTPKKVAELRILDPACGSGSFLLGAYQFLLDWHLKWYLEHEPERHACGKSPALFQAQAGWQLTSSERKRILLDNIFGVDIDQQAVEVTKLSLLLKVLEGQTSETLNQSLKLFHERALPDLANNIKCGNSLIGPDFYEGKQTSMFDQEEVYRINAFDWDKEFPEIMNAGGFDAVIGNPPYVRQEGLGHQFKDYARRHFASYAGTADLYVYFIERSHSLLREGGYFGMICSNKFMRARYGESLRQFLTAKTTIREIIDFGGLPVFGTVTSYPAIFLTQNLSKDNQRFTFVAIKRLGFPCLDEEVRAIGVELDNRSLAGSSWTLASPREIAIFEKMSAVGTPLGQYVSGQIYYGIKTGLNDAFVIDSQTRDKLVAEDPNSQEIIKPFVVGQDVRRYRISFRDTYLVFARRGIDIRQYPALAQYLSTFKERLMPRPVDQSRDGWKGRKSGAYQWYEIQDAVDYYAEFDKPKIVLPAIVKRGSCTIDASGLYSNDKTSIIGLEDLYLVGLINSSALDFAMRCTCASRRGDYFEQKPMYLTQLPIPRLDRQCALDQARHDRLLELVERMLDLHKRLSEVRTEHDKEVLRRQIAATDDEIDRLVYELYGLTEEEIKIVEG